MSKNTECIKINKYGKNIIVGKRIGSDSSYGEVYLGCRGLNCKKKLAIKQTPILSDNFVSRKVSKNSRLPKQHNTIKNMAERELYFMKKVSLLSEKKITIHTPTLIKYSKCNKCSYLNERILKLTKETILKNKHRCLVTLSPLMDGDYYDLIDEKIKEKNLSGTELITYFFQILTGVYAIHKYLNIAHRDLHGSNILYFKTYPKKNQCIKYIINKKKYLIPDIGIVCVVNDFGLSTESTNKNLLRKDYEDVLECVIYRIDKNIIQKLFLPYLNNTGTVEDLIDKLGSSISVDKCSNIIYTVNLDKELT